MSGVNKVFLLGNLGADPEVRELQSGNRMATMSLATSRKWRDREGELQEATQWHRLKVWGRLVDVVEQYTSKGSRIHIEGRIEYDQYERDGVTRYTTDIVVQELTLLGDGHGAAQDAPRAQEAPRPAPRAPQPAQAPPAAPQPAPAPPKPQSAADAYVNQPAGTPQPASYPEAPAKPGRKKYSVDDLPF